MNETHVINETDAEWAESHQTGLSGGVAQDGSADAAGALEVDLDRVFGDRHLGLDHQRIVAQAIVVDRVLAVEGALGRQRDRVIGEYRVTKTGSVRRAARWRLLPTDGSGGLV